MHTLGKLGSGEGQGRGEEEQQDGSGAVRGGGSTGEEGSEGADRERENDGGSP